MLLLCAISPGRLIGQPLDLVESSDIHGAITTQGTIPLGGAAVSLFEGAGMFVNPATGLSEALLPDYAVDSVTVLPNPYAVEFGRFASGLVVVQTRRAADRWKMRLTDFTPTFRTKRGAPLDILGISSFS